eukprot:381977-Pyramimonas_sp.AAC.1
MPPRRAGVSAPARAGGGFLATLVNEGQVRRADFGLEIVRARDVGAAPVEFNMNGARVGAVH